MGEVANSSGRGVVSRRDLTKGSIIRNLLSLSWPMVIQQSLYMMTLTVEMMWVGKLGAAAIAGVGVATIVFMVAMSSLHGFVIGSRALIARFIGAGDGEGANHVAGQAFVISTVYVTVMATIGFFVAEPMLNLFGLEADVIAAGAIFLRIMFAGWVPMSFWSMTFGIMQASGDAVTPMKIQVVVRSIHVLLVPFLIFGWWVFPRLGVGGAAMTQVISQSLASFLGLWVLFRGRSRLRLTLSNFRLDLNIIWRIVKIGIPATGVSVQRSFGNLVLTWFMVPFGTLAVAAHSLVQRVEMVLFLPSAPIGNAAGVLVGQNLGANQPERAERSGWLAAAIVGTVMLIGSLVILLWAERLIGVFNTEPALVELASAFLRIAAAGYLVMSFVLVLQQCISGAGDTLPALLFSLLSLWVVQVPLAFLLPQVNNLGVYGVRWALVTGMLVGAVINVIYFRSGRWQRKKV